MTGPDRDRASLAVIGDWSMQVKLLSLPDLKPIVTEELGSEVIPRSVALADFEGQAYVLCGLGDGQLHNWRLATETARLSGELGCLVTGVGEPGVGVLLHLPGHHISLAF